MLIWSLLQLTNDWANMSATFAWWMEGWAAWGACPSNVTRVCVCVCVVKMEGCIGLKHLQNKMLTKKVLWGRAECWMPSLKRCKSTMTYPLVCRLSETDVTIIWLDGEAGEDILATCQCQGCHALRHTLLYRLFNSKWDHNLQNKHHVVLKQILN